MRKVILRVCLVLVLLTSGCEQQNQKQWKYRLEKTGYGYTVFLPREDYTFVKDVKVVLQDKQFKTHIIF